MKAEYVNPFLEGTYELCKAMLSCTATRTGLAISDGGKRPREMMALIGFSGAVKGTAGLSLPTQTGLAMANRLLMTDMEEVDETVSDTLGELVNIVSGSAKAKLSNLVGETLELSLPVVLRGESFSVYSPSKAIWLEVPFDCELGPFSLRLSFQF
jgi:chemotaxis protein CheX